MHVDVYWPPTRKLDARLALVRAAARPGSPANARCLGDIRQIIISDNIEKLLGRGLLAGVDKGGRPLARMADSTFRNPRRGFGPVLVPRGLASRFIANLEVVWTPGPSGSNVLAMRYRDFVSKKGYPIPLAHLTGNARLPKRDVGGYTPTGWNRIKARTAQYAVDVLRST